MTEPVSQTPHPATRTPHAKTRWERPALSRIDTSEAENSANPGGGDNVFTMGS